MCCINLLTDLDVPFITYISLLIISLASIAKKRPVHYDSVLSALIDFNPNFESSMGGHAASIQYAVRIALLGFLRCSHSSIFEVKYIFSSIMLMNIVLSFRYY